MTDDPTATQKPIELMSALIKSFPPSDIVADPFLGTASMLFSDPPYAMPKLQPQWDHPRTSLKDWILDTRFGCGIMRTGPRVLTIVDGGELAQAVKNLHYDGWRYDSTAHCYRRTDADATIPAARALRYVTRTPQNRRRKRERSKTARRNRRNMAAAGKDGQP